MALTRSPFLDLTIHPGRFTLGWTWPFGLLRHDTFTLEAAETTEMRAVLEGWSRGIYLTTTDKRHLILWTYSPWPPYQALEQAGFPTTPT
jgi:hypothetical protein